MKIFIDFEATQPGNEIIAVGAYAENGDTFYSLVKPQLSSISQYISQLTHITEKQLESAETIDQVMFEFYNWVNSLVNNITDCRFIAYGDDATFLKATLPVVKNEKAFTIMAIMLAKIEDCSKDVFKFFKGTISLINAFNYIQSEEAKQKHNPLEDAIMLEKIYKYTQNNQPLTEHPFKKDVPEVDVKMPSGTFWCSQGKKKNKVITNFNNCDEAIDWLIKNKIRPMEGTTVHRNRIMNKIMTAIRTGHKYCDYTWGRNK